MAFSQTSRLITISPPPLSILSAECERINGTYKSSSICLNDILGINDGEFKWGGRDFAATAKYIRLVGNVLTAMLPREDGMMNFTEVDLDECIENQDGDLVFIG